jgi:hypothetical protein
MISKSPIEMSSGLLASLIIDSIWPLKIKLFTEEIIEK